MTSKIVRTERSWSALVQKYEEMELPHHLKAGILHQMADFDLLTDQERLERLRFFWEKAKEDNRIISEKAKEQLFFQLISFPHWRKWLLGDTEGGWEVIQEIFKAILASRREHFERSKLPEIVRLLKKGPYKENFSEFLQSYYQHLIGPVLWEIKGPWSKFEDEVRNNQEQVSNRLIDVAITLNYTSLLNRDIGTPALPRLEKYLNLEDQDHVKDQLVKLLNDREYSKLVKVWAKLRGRKKH